MAVLHERGALPGATASLAPVVAIVAVAGLGFAVGAWASRHRPRWIGWAAMVTNGAVFALYGFLLAFFGLGGSR